MKTQESDDPDTAEAPMTSPPPVHPDVAAAIALHTFEGQPARPQPPAEPDFTDHPNGAALRLLFLRLNEKTKHRAQRFGFDDIEDYADAARKLLAVAATVLAGISTRPGPFTRMDRHLGSVYRLVRANATADQLEEFDRLVEAMNDLDDKNGW